MGAKYIQREIMKYWFKEKNVTSIPEMFVQGVLGVTGNGGVTTNTNKIKTKSITIHAYEEKERHLQYMTSKIQKCEAFQVKMFYIV